MTATAASAPSPPATAERSDVARAVDSVLALRSYRNLTISRNGAHIAYSVAVEPVTAPARRSVFAIDRRTSSALPRLVSAAPGKSADERFPDFSPDGMSMAILSDADRSGDRQIYIVDLLGNSAARRLGHFDGALGAPRFSPDGRQIAVLYTEPAADTGGAGPDAPMISGLAALPSRVAIVDVATGEHRPASPPDLHVHDFAWSPDGLSIAVIASPAAPQPNFFVAKLYLMTIANGELRLLVAPHRQLGDPQFSPDGRWIAFISGLMSDEGNTGGDLFVVPAAGGAVRNLTRGRKATITAARWRPDSLGLLVDEIVDGRSALSAIPLDGGAGEVLFQADAAIRGFNVSADGETVAFLHDAFDSAQSIWSGPVRAPERVEATRQPFDAPWGEVKSLHVPSEAYSIQSFLVAPKAMQPGRKYPLITMVHGGPAASWVPAAFEYGALAAGDYFLLLPNPRGSFGLGEDFQEANIKDFGYGDLRDIRASIRAAAEAAPIDTARVGIMGWSYGGFMAMWAPTQTPEFRASVAGAGISNWQSYQGQTDTPGWMPPFFGATVYDDPGVYAKSSPIGFIKQAHTPILMLVGDKDTDCPLPQSRELWGALVTLGVPAQLVVYPNEAHGFARAEHRRDRVERMLDWFDRHMGAR